VGQVVLIRHGQTEWSANGRHTSRTDLPLTAEGERQARDLGKTLAGWSFVAVFSSPKRRARRTAELAGLTVTAVDEDLVEWDYGAYEGVTTAEIRASRPDWDLWRDGCPGGETASEVGARVDRVIAEVRALDGDAALFAHGHVLRVLGSRWVLLAPEDGGRFALSTGTVCTLGWERETPVFWRWNEAVA
jgi:broad specificity phosphatase PhoE